jgi:hypothetical protein
MLGSIADRPGDGLLLTARAQDWWQPGRQCTVESRPEPKKEVAEWLLRNPWHARLRRIRVALAFLLFLGALCSAGYSGYWFYRAENVRADNEELFEVLRTGRTRGGFFGGPVSRHDWMVMAIVYDREKSAWMYLTFASVFGGIGYLLYPRA